MRLPHDRHSATYWLRMSIVSCTALFYVSSFFLPVFLLIDNWGNSEQVAGWQVCHLAYLVLFGPDLRELITGSWAIILLGSFIANPFLWAGMLLLCWRYPRTWLQAAAAGTIALGFGLVPFFKMPELLLFGYYVWVAGILVLVTGSLTAWMVARQSRKIDLTHGTKP